MGSKRARLRWTIAFVAWLCVVWGHSLMPGDMSSAESSRFVFLVRPFFELFGCTDEQLMTLFIRKCAHFGENTVLVLLAYQMAVAWFGKSRAALVLTLALWVAIPCIDETIQLFIPDRTGSPVDVLIDMSGGLLALVILRLAYMGYVQE